MRADGLCDGGDVALRRGGQRQDGCRATRAGHAFDKTVAIVLDVGGTGQRVDADAAFLAGLAQVFATRDTGLVIDRADIVHRAQTVGRLDAAGVVDDQRNARVNDGLEGGVHRLGYPVGANDGGRTLVDGLTDQFRRIDAKVVIVLRAEPGDRAALSGHDQTGILGALLHDRPERIIGLAADDENLCAFGIGHACAKGQDRGGGQDLSKFHFHVSSLGEAAPRGL